MTKKYKATLCWYCQRAVGGCSWSRKFKPVEGWDAIPTKIWYGHKAEPLQSYIVKSCPQFLGDGHEE